MDKIVNTRLIGRPAALCFTVAVWLEAGSRCGGDVSSLCERAGQPDAEGVELAAWLLSRLAAAGERRRTQRGYPARPVPEPWELRAFLHTKPGRAAYRAAVEAFAIGVEAQDTQKKPRDLGLEALRKNAASGAVTRAQIIRLGHVRLGWSTQETLDATPGELVVALGLNLEEIKPNWPV